MHNVIVINPNRIDTLVPATITDDSFDVGMFHAVKSSEIPPDKPLPWITQFVLIHKAITFTIKCFSK